ncbi:sugar phosphate isomerase/epimerase family protein [Streptomyces fuscigenes]|uniref:sugar phosphate isomerase/epimerase family protein n=1 Tax=Streptomyces fuscigenes TaxID=1528880 RepID=UPI001F36F7AC|nr:sugar phosphate isomerase/epimerase family protein [Streptomyces fuscigenes]MCF3961143.1 sugar phosphate isomerase/epimerase [Streptomyces fuscigenes]
MTAHPRLSLNQATVKHADLRTTLGVCRDSGIPAVGLWRESVHDTGRAEAVRLLAGSGLRLSSLCRGGFFTAAEGRARRAALDDNRRAIEETAELAAGAAPGSAAVLVLVPGGLPDRDLPQARLRVVDAIAELAEEAGACGVTLALEPMHPLYAADRGVVSTLGQALDIAEQFAGVGVVVDTFHVWWDPELNAQINRAGRSGRLVSFQVNDWITPLPADALLARGMMGEGHIDLPAVAAMVQEAGYRGDIEVEIFNQEVWDSEPGAVAGAVVEAFAKHVLS